jgi:hypothetical protein
MGQICKLYQQSVIFTSKGEGYQRRGAALWGRLLALPANITGKAGKAFEWQTLKLFCPFIGYEGKKCFVKMAPEV